MKGRRHARAGFAHALLVAALVAGGCGGEGERYLTVSGRSFRFGGHHHVQLRGVNFNNQPALGFWHSPDIGAIDVNRADYHRVSAWGANHVRFGLSIGWYEQDRVRFFAMLDRQLRWARESHLWLIPVLYGLPGNCGEDYVFSCPLWANPAHQQEVVDFWRDLARRYADEPVIAGYDLLNEPTPRGGDGAEDPARWYALAQRIRDAIVRVDTHHFVVVEDALARGFTHMLRGSNVVYSQHYYAPVSLTTASPGCSYPGSCDGRQWDRGLIERRIRAGELLGYRFSADRRVPLLVGEFGSRKRAGYAQWVTDSEDAFERLGLHWSFFVMRDSRQPVQESFGLYTCPGAGNLSCPDDGLIAVQRRHLRGTVRP